MRSPPFTLPNPHLGGVSLPTMSFFTVLTLISYTFAQSSSSTSVSDPRTNTCLRRSVLIYTQDSSTYVVTNIGSTSFAPTPSFCQNVSVSVSTVYQEQTSTQPSPSVLADAGFENGQNNPFNTTASSSEVTAQVAQGGPLQPYSGSSYLYVFFVM